MGEGGKWEGGAEEREGSGREGLKRGRGGGLWREGRGSGKGGTGERVERGGGGDGEERVWKERGGRVVVGGEGGLWWEGREDCGNEGGVEEGREGCQRGGVTSDWVGLQMSGLRSCKN